jgi:methylated-DNA-[protein]-cysteine S-methyltransferase
MTSNLLSSMTHFVDTFSTRFGPFSVALDESGALLATAFGTRDALRARLQGCHLMNDKSPAALVTISDDKTMARPVRDAVRAYCAGELQMFTGAIAARGTAFQQRVWRALQQIPFGETRSYGELAAELGNPAASRAVGRANATNPVCLIVPCHRVIGADGSLTGFAFGEDLKRRLLEHERSVAEGIQTRKLQRGERGDSNFSNPGVSFADLRV